MVLDSTFKIGQQLGLHDNISIFNVQKVVGLTLTLHSSMKLHEISSIRMLEESFIITCVLLMRIRNQTPNSLPI